MSLVLKFKNNLLLNVRNIAFRSYTNLVNKESSDFTNLASSLKEDEINWDHELEQYKTPSIFDRCDEDISDVKPYLAGTFNFAAYINKSETLQQFLKLGVNLYEVEKNVASFKTIVKLNFETDCKKHLIFLNDFIPAENLGYFLTKNPFIFKQDLEDLQTRINYLESKKFTHNMICNILIYNPFWINFSTRNIDSRLGLFQNVFELSGDEVRYLTTKLPRLITHKWHHVNMITFVMKEELGFEGLTLKKILLDRPKIWMENQHRLITAFEYLHKTMNISHEMISESPGLLTCRQSRLKERHEFLVKLGRAQYDCRKENYVPIWKLVEGTDIEFCQIAKCTVQDYNLYLKTL